MRGWRRILAWALLPSLLFAGLSAGLELFSCKRQPTLSFDPCCPRHTPTEAPEHSEIRRQSCCKAQHISWEASGERLPSNPELSPTLAPSLALGGLLPPPKLQPTERLGTTVSELRSTSPPLYLVLGALLI